MKKDTNIRPGKTVHIGKPFKSHDGVYLNNRFMCIFSIENDNLLLMPMSTFHSQEAKNKKLTQKVFFEYLKIHGSKRDSYIKCNQIYVLSKEDFNAFDELQYSRRIKNEHFKKLQNHVKSLEQDKKIKFLKRKMIFKDPDGLIKKEQINESDYEYE